MPYFFWTSFRFLANALLFALAVGAVLFPSGPSTAAAETARTPSVAIVKTSLGAVRGIALQNMAAYLGIPYAAPPVGSLRWQPPQPYPRWAGTRAATAFGNHCPQGPSPAGFPSLTEDCLFLNVFAPAGTKAGANLPVMVWLHGGAFVAGESDDYDPDRFVARGVIVVTLNYRLGYLGFLATAGLDAEPHIHANYGLLDQQSALRWVRCNVSAFGGDPARVTVFGQSAGGASTFAQLLSPGSAGLFSRAIIQSGAYDILSLPTLTQAESSGNALAAALSCAPQDAACLRSRSVEQILLAQQSSSASPLIGGPSPAVDGRLIPQAPEDALAFGAYNHVPVVQGSNHDEFRYFTALLFDLSSGALTAPEYPLAVQATLAAGGLGSFTNAVLAQYPLSNYASPDLAYSALTTDGVFSTPTFLTDVLLSARSPVFAYQFSDENAPEDFLPPVSFPYGAAHASELQFLYDSFDRSAPPLTADEQRLAATMIRYWTRFAANGTPNGFGAPLWTPYVGLLDNMESLVPPRPGLFFSFVPEHKALFWAALAAASQLSTGTFASKHYLSIDAAGSAARTVRPNGRRRS